MTKVELLKAEEILHVVAQLRKSSVYKVINPWEGRVVSSLCLMPFPLQLLFSVLCPDAWDTVRSSTAIRI